MKRIEIAIVVALLAILSLILMGQGCEPSAGEVQREQTERLHAEAVRQVGTPAITNFQELKFAKMIAELRDTEVTTYTYTVDRNGRAHFLCQSVGYGLPYSTQMTNPMKTVHTPHGGDHAMPQPEPNGLFNPDNVAATWVLCLDEATGDVKPVYSEPALLVAPFRLKAAGSYTDRGAK